MNTELQLFQSDEYLKGGVCFKATGLWYTQYVTLRRWLDDAGIRMDWYGHGGFFSFEHRSDAELFLARWFEEMREKTVPRAERRDGCPYLPTPRYVDRPVQVEDQTDMY